MKKILIYMLIISSLMACRDESLNPIPTFKHGVTFIATQKSSAFLDLSKLDGAKMEFDTKSDRADLIAKVDIIAEFVPSDGPKISKLYNTLSVINGSTSILYSDLMKTLALTSAMLKPGDVIRVKFLATTPDGRTFSEDNTVGTLPTFGSSGFTPAINATVACVYDSSQFLGKTWVVAIDEWNDYPKGAEIKISAGPAANQLILGVFATPDNHKDVVITISDTNTGAITVAKQAYGSYAGDPAIWSAEGTGTLSGCTGNINLTLTHSSVEYGSGAAKLSLILKK